MTVFTYYISKVKFPIFDVLSSVNNLEQLELAKSHNGECFSSTQYPLNIFIND